MTETWFTSDTHFGHVAIPVYQPNRLTEFHMADEKDIPGMNEGLVEQWNSQVGPNDTVWHLGDFAMGQIDRGLEYVARLNGAAIHLILGNHDRPHPCRGQAHKHEEWMRRYMDAGFASIEMLAHYDMDGVPVLMSHFPYEGDHSDEERYTEWRLPNHGQILVHGHVHGLWQTRGSMVNVGMDAHGGKLLHRDEVVAIVHQVAARMKGHDIHP